MGWKWAGQSCARAREREREDGRGTHKPEGRWSTAPEAAIPSPIGPVSGAVFCVRLNSAHRGHFRFVSENRSRGRQSRQYWRARG